MQVKMSDTVNRFEVIDETGRAYVAEGVSIELSYQDQGRTLKAFVKPGEPVVREKGWRGFAKLFERRD